MNALRASGLEGVHTPIHGPLHGWRTRNSPADFVGQPVQVGFKRRGLQGFGNHPLGGILRNRSAQRNGEENAQ
jgi:hypothetical protein